MGSGTLTKLLMGVGLGILAVSCLTSTVVFGRFANSFTKIQKLDMKFSFDSTSAIYSTSVAIAVLGCLSAAAAIGAIVLTIFLEDQTIVLIAVGGASALFAFGCIVAEGVYSQKVTSYNRSYDHKNAQKWIKNAIKELYEQGVTNIKKSYKDRTEYAKYLKKIPEFKDFETQLGKENNEKHIVTYHDIWGGKYYDNLTLYDGGSYIYAKIQFIDDEDPYVNIYMSAPVAGIKFLYKEAYTQKQSICWYIKDETDVECKTFDTKKITIDMEDEFTPVTVGTLTEYIVDGEYYSTKDVAEKHIDVDYKISYFPQAYKIIDYDTYKSNDNYQDSHFGFDQDSNHFKVSGKDYAKASLKEDIKRETTVDKYSDSYKFLLAVKKPDNYKQYLTDCEKYFEEEDEEEGGTREEDPICGSHGYDFLNDLYEDNYEDNNKGKIAPQIKKYRSKTALKYAQSMWKYDDNYQGIVLYDVAIGSLVIQIVAIIIWAVGRFLGGFGGGNDQKSPSEGEA